MCGRPHLKNPPCPQNVRTWHPSLTAEVFYEWTVTFLTLSANYKISWLVNDKLAVKQRCNYPTRRRQVGAELPALSNFTIFYYKSAFLSIINRLKFILKNSWITLKHIDVGYSKNKIKRSLSPSYYSHQLSYINIWI